MEKELVPRMLQAYIGQAYKTHLLERQQSTICVQKIQLTKFNPNSIQQSLHVMHTTYNVLKTLKYYSNINQLYTFLTNNPEVLFTKLHA